MNYALSLSGRRRIQLLWLLKYAAFPVLPLLAWLVSKPGVYAMPMVLGGLVLHVAIRAWEMSRRRQFVREAQFPRYLGVKLRALYPQLSAGDVDLVQRGLRQFFLAYLRSNRKFVAMPSQVADAMWHEFILHTRAYESWCEAAFGTLLHHTPAEVLGRDPQRNDGLRRTWYWACKEESIDPRKPTRLPLLFALDKKFGIPGGFHYVPDCKEIDRQSGSDAYCGTSFGDGGASGGAGEAGGTGGGGDSFSYGDAAGFGGSESSGSGDGGSSDGGGCGGGCGGD